VVSLYFSDIPSRAIVLQHVKFETPGIMANLLDSAGISTESIRTFENQPVPGKMGDAAGLIIMGGPMGVYEQGRYPFLRDEMRLIEQALQEEKPVLGICLGSQLLAATLGAVVTRGTNKEIGWHPVTLTESAADDRLWAGVEPSFVAFHWHGDIFELPRGAVSLASSDLTACQAFRYGQKAYGFLFHMEVTKEIIENMVKTFADELQETSIDGSDIIKRTKDYLSDLQKIGRVVFQRWVSLQEKGG